MRRKSDTVADHMTTKRLETLDVHQSLEVADDLMALRRIRHLPVVDGGQVVGVVSERDLFRAALVESIRHGWLPAEAMHRVQVVAVMAAPAITTCPTTPMDEAIRKMLDEDVGCLPVVQDGVLRGLLTTTDVLRYAASGRQRSRVAAAHAA